MHPSNRSPRHQKSSRSSAPLITHVFVIDLDTEEAKLAYRGEALGSRSHASVGRPPREPGPGLGGGEAQTLKPGPEK